MKLVRSVATVGFFTALSRILGFIRDALIAKYLGAGLVSDAFFVAFKFPNFFRRLFAEGAFNAAFVPIFSRLYVEKGLKSATLAAEQIFSFLFFILVGFVLIVEGVLPWLMYGIAPGFIETPERFDLALEFTRITFPYILFISLTAFYSGILNSLDRFGAAASMPIVLNIVMIGALVFFASHLETPGHVLVWAVTLGGILQMVGVEAALRKKGVRIRLQWPKITEWVQLLWRKMIPGAIGAGVMQINLLADTIIASLLPEGTISYLFYADRLTQLPLSIIGIAMGTALLPVISKHIQRQEFEKAKETQNRALEISLFFSLPATTALLVLAPGLISVLFERGAFEQAEVAATSATLIAYAIGLPAYVMSKIFNVSFFAQYDTTTPVKMALITILLNILLNLLLMVPLKHVGIALASALAAWVNVSLLGYKLWKLKLFQIDDRLKQQALRIFFSTLGMTSGLIALTAGFEAHLSEPSFKQLCVLGGIICLGLMGYFLSSFLFRSMRLREVLELVRSYKS